MQVSQISNKSKSREILPLTNVGLMCDRYAVDSQQGFENVIVVDNTPIVDESKKDLLLKRLREKFANSGAPIDEDMVQMPWDDEAGTNKG